MNHYETLGLSKNATPEEIQKAFRGMAKLCHPDTNPNDPETAKKFKELMAAFEVLSDPSKKLRYDSLGPQFRSKHSSSKKPKTKEDFENEKRAEKEAERYRTAPTQTELNAIECTFFGNTSTGRNIMVQLKLTEQERKLGGKKTVAIKKRGYCQRCIGDGTLRKICPSCRNVPQYRLACTRCDYTGEVEDACERCEGSGFGGYSPNLVPVQFPPDTQIGHAITIQGEGEIGESTKHQPPGYLRVILV